MTSSVLLSHVSSKSESYCFVGTHSDIESWFLSVSDIKSICFIVSVIECYSTRKQENILRKIQHTQFTSPVVDNISANNLVVPLDKVYEFGEVVGDKESQITS